MPWNTIFETIMKLQTPDKLFYSSIEKMVIWIFRRDEDNVSVLTVLSCVSYLLGHFLKCIAWLMRNLMNDRG